MIIQEELNEIIQDTSVDGELIKFYEMLQEAVSQHSEAKIFKMKGTLQFIVEEDPDLYKSSKGVHELSDLEVLYFYSLLP